MTNLWIIISTRCRMFLMSQGRWSIQHRAAETDPTASACQCCKPLVRSLTRFFSGVQTEMFALHGCWTPASAAVLSAYILCCCLRFLFLGIRTWIDNKMHWLTDHLMCSSTSSIATVIIQWQWMRITWMNKMNANVLQNHSMAGS